MCRGYIPTTLWFVVNLGTYYVYEAMRYRLILFYMEVIALYVRNKIKFYQNI